MKWEWCCLPKQLGGLGIKDIKAQGIALAAKWIFKAFWGNEPWKVLVRNNIERSIIKKGKQWDNIPFWDIIMGDFKMKVFGSKVVSSLWSTWTQVRELLSCRNATGGPPKFIVTDRSIWWGLYLNNKPLALTQIFFAKKME